MKVIKFSLGQLQANCYFLIEENNCLIIDPADEGSFILEELTKRKLNLIGLLASHGHFDHLMAVGEIEKSFSVPFYINKRDLFLVKRIKESAEYFLGFKPLILPILKVKTFPPIPRFKWVNKFKIIFTPGHTPGSCCFYFPQEKIIFTGDTLFKRGIGRYDFSYSNKSDLQASLNKLLKLPEETIIYPGHGEQTTIGEEKRFIISIF